MPCRSAAGLLAALPAAAAAVAHPHLILILADDYGWNDIGYHQNKPSSANPGGGSTTNYVTQTPSLDALAADGVRLENYYVQPLCSPTRGTVLSGRYPSHTGIGPNVIKPSHPYAMPKKEVLLPQLLADAGYATHAVGKWHLGYCDERYTPTFRGFSTYFGYLNGAEDYFTHYRGDSGFTGLDLRNGTRPGVLAAATNASFGSYSTHVFTAEAVRLIAAHDPAVPFFLYLPYQAVHGPLQVPESYVAPYAGHIPKGARLTNAGMVAAMDEGVGNVTAALKRSGMWGDTVLFFSTDNGGPIPHSNNYPLRGHKATNWEGGVRGVAFVRGTDSALAPIPAGTQTMSLMHSTDWLPTLVGLAGGSTTKCQPLDGFDQWGALHGGATQRTSVVHNVPAAGKGLKGGGAVRKGAHKLLLSGMQTAGDMPQTPPDGFAPASNGTIPAPYKMNGTSVWLFDVLADPTESDNLAASHPDVLADLVAFYLQYQETAVPDLADAHGKADPASNPDKRADGAWGPFPGSTMCEYS